MIDNLVIRRSTSDAVFPLPRPPPRDNYDFVAPADPMSMLERQWKPSHGRQLSAPATQEAAAAAHSVVTLSRDQLRALAEKEAQAMLRVSYENALALLDSRALEGTVAATELRMLRFLLGEG